MGFVKHTEILSINKSICLKFPSTNYCGAPLSKKKWWKKKKYREKRGKEKKKRKKEGGTIHKKEREIKTTRKRAF